MSLIGPMANEITSYLEKIIRKQAGDLSGKFMD